MLDLQKEGMQKWEENFYSFCSPDVWYITGAQKGIMVIMYFAEKRFQVNIKIHQQRR